MVAWYNENDPYAAQWLRNLVAAGHLPAGDVDQRSILDVEPADLAGYDQVHWFAGIGGWGLALELAGWPADRPVWTGSCPCQPFSSAGKQSGVADERHLWPAWLRLIRECRPDAIIGEQVEGAVGFGWLDRVFADLEAEGYACGAAVLGAHSVNAPHIRQRLFWGARRCENVGSGFYADGSVHGGGARPSTSGVVSVSSGERAACFEGMAQPSIAGRGAQPRWDDGADGWPEAESRRLLHAGGLADAECDDRRPDLSRRGPQGRTADFWSGAVWLPCLDGKARRVEPGIFPLVAGLPAAMDGLGPISRVGALRGAGNAITAQAAAAFVAAVMECLNHPSPLPSRRS